MAITKLEAAQRQTDEAIRMHFNGSDALAVITVAHAALSLMRDLAEAKGGVALHENFKAFVRPGKEKEFQDALNRIPNFLKHANRDPDAMIDEPVEQYNDGALAWLCGYYEDLAGSKTQPMQVFFSWFTLLNPHIVKEGHPMEAVMAAMDNGLRNESRAAQLDVGNEVLKKQPRK